MTNTNIKAIAQGLIRRHLTEVKTVQQGNGVTVWELDLRKLSPKGDKRWANASVTVEITATEHNTTYTIFTNRFGANNTCVHRAYFEEWALGQAPRLAKY